MAVLLTISEIFSRIELENRHFRHCIVIADPLAEESPTTSTYSIHRWKVYLMGYDSVDDIPGLPSFFEPLSPPKSAKLLEISRKF